MIFLNYYVDLKLGNSFTLLAGPFRSEAAARPYQKAAYRLALRDNPLNAFAGFGVVRINDHAEPGVYNDELGIPADELIAT